jgi:aromatic ring-opening dioxygenase LigB subunit
MVVAETRIGENSYPPTDTERLGSAQILNQFRAVTPHQAILSDQMAITVDNKMKTTARSIVRHSMNSTGKGRKIGSSNEQRSNAVLKILQH